jgi:hypothetical protein
MQQVVLIRTVRVSPTKALALPCTEAAGSEFDTVTVLRLREIAERNRIREEAGLPILSVPKELRRMKEAVDTEKFGNFGHAHRERVYDKMLRQERRRRGDPNWTPTGMLSGGGMWFNIQVERQLGNCTGGLLLPECERVSLSRSARP